MRAARLEYCLPRVISVPPCSRRHLRRYERVVSGTSAGGRKRARTRRRFAAPTWVGGLEAAHVLDEVGLLARGEAELEAAVVVVDDGAERRIAPVVVEAALHLGDDPAQRRRPVAERRGAVGLEVVDADLLAGVEVPAGVAELRRHVAARAASLAVEDRLAASRGGAVDALGVRHRQRELVQVERRELRGDQVARMADVGEAGPGSDRELLRVR